MMTISPGKLRITMDNYHIHEVNQPEIAMFNSEVLVYQMVVQGSKPQFRLSRGPPFPDIPRDVLSRRSQFDPNLMK